MTFQGMKGHLELKRTIYIYHVRRVCRDVSLPCLFCCLALASLDRPRQPISRIQDDKITKLYQNGIIFLPGKSLYHKIIIF